MTYIVAEGVRPKHAPLQRGGHYYSNDGSFFVHAHQAVFEDDVARQTSARLAEILNTATPAEATMLAWLEPRCTAVVTKVLADLRRDVADMYVGSAGQEVADKVARDVPLSAFLQPAAVPRIGKAAKMHPALVGIIRLPWRLGDVMLKWIESGVMLPNLLDALPTLSLFGGKLAANPEGSHRGWDPLTWALRVIRDPLQSRHNTRLPLTFAIDPVFEGDPRPRFEITGMPTLGGLSGLNLAPVTSSVATSAVPLDLEPFDFFGGLAAATMVIAALQHAHPILPEHQAARRMQVGPPGETLLITSTGYKLVLVTGHARGAELALAGMPPHAEDDILLLSLRHANDRVASTIQMRQGQSTRRLPEILRRSEQTMQITSVKRPDEATAALQAAILSLLRWDDSIDAIRDEPLSFQTRWSAAGQALFGDAIIPDGIPRVRASAPGAAQKTLARLRARYSKSWAPVHRVLTALLSSTYEPDRQFGDAIGMHLPTVESLRYRRALDLPGHSQITTEDGAHLSRTTTAYLTGIARYTLDLTQREAKQVAVLSKLRKFLGTEFKEQDWKDEYKWTSGAPAAAFMEALKTPTAKFDSLSGILDTMTLPYSDSVYFRSADLAVTFRRLQVKLKTSARGASPSILFRLQKPSLAIKDGVVTIQGDYKIEIRRVPSGWLTVPRINRLNRDIQTWSRRLLRDLAKMAVVTLPRFFAALDDGVLRERRNAAQTDADREARRLANAKDYRVAMGVAKRGQAALCGAPLPTPEQMEADTLRAIFNVLPV